MIVIGDGGWGQGHTEAKNTMRRLANNGIKSIMVAFGNEILSNASALRKFNERYYFSGKYITDNRLIKLLEEVEIINNNKPITFHEIISFLVKLITMPESIEVPIIDDPP